MKANHIIIVPETHWDREWYLPFQEYRARLVIMMDKLLNILKTDPDYKNFTFDGQTIPIEDYLEVKPEKEEEIKKFVKERRLSIGPMYILPDEFLISGESMIRNLIIGHQIAEKYGRVMKAGYIPDPFGHIAQLPQIISGFEIPSILFWRGFGNEFVENNLNAEFRWNAPGNAASALGIFLASGYGSIANMSNKRLKDGTFKTAQRTIRNMIRRFEKITATPIVVLNSGSDHHEAKPEIPAIIKQWNETFPDQHIEQNDFEYYVEKVLACNPKLKDFQGELRGGKYNHLLSGVFSARMWIKQRNTAIEYLYEKYTEPISAITWALDKFGKFEYPHGYIQTGLKWLIKNHPHDSICGCSIDEVHDEMKTRFDWAEQIGDEVFKSSMLYLEDMMRVDTQNDARFALIAFNPLPWKRTDIVSFNAAVFKTATPERFPDDIKIIDADGKEIEFQSHLVEEEPRYTQESNMSHRFSFLTELPACGYKLFYLVPGEESSEFQNETDEFRLGQNSIENEFYKVSIDRKGMISVLEKNSGDLYEGILEFVDEGDWGDEYDFSGPKENQTDLVYTTEDGALLGIAPIMDGPNHKMLQIKMNLKLPLGLEEERYNRMTFLLENRVHIYISLYKGVNRIDFKINYQNLCKDHRLRVLFPTKIKTDTVYADGHFYVVPREIKIPAVEKWAQKPLGMNHQKDFVAINDEKKCFAILNKGLPEYEAVKNEQGTVTLAITLLRCIEWLSRGDFATRMSNAGPDLNTPGGQCLGEHTFELSLVVGEFPEEKSYMLDSRTPDWNDHEIHVKGKEFNNPFKAIFPLMTRTPLRLQDKVILTPIGILSYMMAPHKSAVEPFLPSEMSFLEIDNSNIQLSALKKSEENNYLIIRCYNISPASQAANLKVYDGIAIKDVEIVNLLEEKPINKIKADCVLINPNNIELKLEPHVIATLKLNL